MSSRLAPALAGVFVFVAIGPARGSVIQTEVSPINGHTYHLLSPNTWTGSEAEAEALSKHAHLATVRGQSENDWIWDTFKGSFPDYRFGVRYLWIGLSRSSLDGAFTWASGEPVTYTNWDGAQPSSGYDGGLPELYAQMGYYDLANWNDAPDNFLQIVPDHSYELAGVVEVVPEPSAIMLFAIGGLIIVACGRWSRRRS